MKSEIKFVYSQTAQPRNGDAGSCVVGYYFVEDGVLRICDESGRPTGKVHRLQDGDDPRVIASRLTLAAWRATAGNSDFNRTLEHPPMGWR